MSTASEVRTWHVQQTLDPAVLALMCPWPGCGALAPVDPARMHDQVGRQLNCASCGLPSTVPPTLEV